MDVIPRRLTRERDALRPTVVAAALLAAFALHAWASARHKTPTVDEFAHVPAGYVGLVSGDFTLYGKTPPLGRTLFSLPLLLHDPFVPDPPTGNRMAGWYPWLYASGFFRANVERHGIAYVNSLYRDARLVVIGLAVILGVTLFVWARFWHGTAGGLLAVALFTLDPNVLAHSRLATVDMAETLFFFLATGLFTWHLARPRLSLTVATGLAAGAALATKFTALLLLPVFLVLAAVHLARTRPGARRARAGSLALSLAGIAVLAVFVVDLAYGFGGTFRPLGDYGFRSRLLTSFQAGAPGWTPVPFPSDFVRGFDAQQVDLETADFPNYLNGQWSSRGWWYYYPLAWAVKTPLALILLLAGAALFAVFRLGRGRHAPGDDPDPPASLASLSAWAAGIAAGTLLFAACFLTHLNIGVRYILPVYPFAFLAAGSLGRLWRGRLSRPTVAVLLAVVALAASTLSAFPHYLGYFNLLAGGPAHGWKVLANSNNDWGQDLIYLRREMERRGLDSIRLAYFGHADPEAYGIDYSVPLPEGSGEDALIPAAGPAPYRFQPGTYAISVNLLVGLPYQVVDHGYWVQAGVTLSEPQQIFAWFRRRQPERVIGGSIVLFQVDGTTS